MPTWIGVVLDQQPLLEGPPEDRAVRGRRVEVGVPGVQVRVEMHQRDRAVLRGDRPQHRQRDRMVAADRDDPAVAARRARRRGRAICSIAALDVERRDRDVTGVDYLDALNGVPASSTW